MDPDPIDLDRGVAQVLVDLVALDLGDLAIDLMVLALMVLVGSTVGVNAFVVKNKNYAKNFISFIDRNPGNLLNATPGGLLSKSSGRPAHLPPWKLRAS
jgi:hypothetical protein